MAPTARSGATGTPPLRLLPAAAVLLLVCRAGRPCAAPQPAEAASWRQDAFWISFWAGPQVPVPELDGRFAELVECNFTGFMGFHGKLPAPGAYPPTVPGGYPATIERVTAEISLCAKYGLRCVPSLCEIPPYTLPPGNPCIELGRGSPTFWGFQLLDEPLDYPRVANWTRQIAAARPDALRFVNLLGAGDWDFFKTVDDYAASIKTYVKLVRPQVLSMDFYPVFAKVAPAFDAPPCGAKDCRESKDLYGASLAVLRQEAEAAPGGPIPFWSFFNVLPYNVAHGDPTEAMLRWQAMTSLAYGSSGVMYFCYWTCFGSLGGGLIISRGREGPGEPGIVFQRSPHWYEAQRLNGVLKIYGGFLLGRKSVGVYRASSDQTVGVPYHVDRHPWNGSTPTNTTGPLPVVDCAIAGLSNTGLRVGVGEPAEWLIGQFSLAGAPRWGPTDSQQSQVQRDSAIVPPTHTLAVLLHNQDESRNVWSTVQFAEWINTTYGAILELDAVHGGLRPFLDDSPFTPGYQVALDAAGARVFVLQAAGAIPSPPPPPTPVPPPPVPVVANQIKDFAWIWRTQEEGGGSVNASNGMNCTDGSIGCSWLHATTALVVNPLRSTESDRADVADCEALAKRNVTCIVSVSHVFLIDGTSGNLSLSPDYEARWRSYIALMWPILRNVRGWYGPSVAGLYQPAETLQTIVNVLKRDTAAIDVLLTMPSQALGEFNLSDVPSNLDILAAEACCAPLAKRNVSSYMACSVRWPEVESTLDALAAFAMQHAHMRVAVIPDATAATYDGIGGLSQRVLNNRHLAWCLQQPRCVAVMPFVGAGHWNDTVIQQGEAYDELLRIGDAVRSQNWSNTSLGAAQRLYCPLAGVLTHTPCVHTPTTLRLRQPADKFRLNLYFSGAVSSSHPVRQCSPLQVDHGCDNVLLPLDGVTVTAEQPDGNALYEFLDYCDASPRGRAVDPTAFDWDYSCCANHTK
jgi:hypothetical protein